MDFDFTQEQIALRGLAREVLTAESSSQDVRTQMADATGYSESLWKQLAETGPARHHDRRGPRRPGLGHDRAGAGAGGDGPRRVPGPYFATVVLAATAIVAGGDRAQLRRLPAGHRRAAR